MNKELEKLLMRLNAKKAEVRKKAEGGDLEEAKKAKAELADLQARFDMLSELDDDAAEGAANGGAQDAGNGAGEKPKKSIIAAFGDILRASARRVTPAAEDLAVYAQVTNMTEGVDADGGYTVPQDVRTDINELRRATDNLEELVNVEHVRTLSGSRVIEVDAESTPFADVDEGADFADEQGPQLKKITYTIVKVGGIFKATKELLADTAENIVRLLKKWIAKKLNATRNKKILACIDGFAETGAVAVDGVDSIKDVFNVQLDPALTLGSVILTNQDGFNYLDKLKNDKKEYILQPDPTQPTKRLLFGRYPVKVVSNRTLKTTAVTTEVGEQKTPTHTADKYPFYFGNFAEAVTLFDRDVVTVESSDVAGDLWKKDLIGFKVRDRFDVKSVDEKAVIKGYYTKSLT